MTIKRQILVLEAIDPRPFPEDWNHPGYRWEISFAFDKSFCTRTFKILSVAEEKEEATTERQDSFDEWNW